MQNSQYNKRTIENKHMIDKMNNYMLTNKNLTKYLQDCTRIEKVSKKKNVTFKPSNNNQKLFFTYQEDNLFWLYYIMLYGIDTYKMLGDHTYAIENEEKMKCIELLKFHKAIIKEQKTKVIDCENDLINNKKISLSTFIVLCIIKNINVCIIFNNIYYQYESDEKPNYIIHKINNLYGYEPYNNTIYEAVKINRYHITNINKPIMAISNYKVDDIKNISTLLDISLYDDNQKNKNKVMLYDDIKNVIQSNIE